MRYSRELSIGEYCVLMVKTMFQVAVQVGSYILANYFVAIKSPEFISFVRKNSKMVATERLLALADIHAIRWSYIVGRVRCNTPHKHTP